ncbi:MAG: ROK family glucokinase [Nocardioidaceae bacterium]
MPLSMLDDEEMGVQELESEAFDVDVSADALTIGVDVGGTKIAAGVVDAAGRIIEEVRRETPARASDATVAAIIDVVQGLTEQHPIAAVGIGAAGFIDADRSTVLFAPNLSWRDVPLRQAVEEAAGVPVVVENDANAAAWGEFVFGSGKDDDDLLLVTVGTGIGGGLVADHRLYRGAFGIAAEIGHMRVVPGGHRCGCGNLGCWEQYASGSALVREARAFAAAGTPMAADLLALANGDASAIDGPMITLAATQGDAWAIELLESAGRWLGEGIASLAAVLDPGVVSIGGGVAEAGELLLEPIRAAFRAQLTGRRFRPELEIRQATLGNRAGLIGAADLARHQ